MPLRSRPRPPPPQPPPRPHLGHFASWPSMVGWARSGSRLRMALRVRETYHRGCALPVRVRRGSAPCVSAQKARPDHQEVRPDRQTGPHAPARGCGTRARADAAHAQMRCSTHARMRHMTRVTARVRLSHGRFTCAFAFRLSHCRRVRVQHVLRICLLDLVIVRTVADTAIRGILPRALGIRVGVVARMRTRPG